MAEHYTIDFEGTLYFTDDGTDTGKPCRCQVAGLAKLKSAWGGSTAISANGTPYNFKVAKDGRGTVLKISPFVISKDVLDDLETMFDQKTDDDEAIVVHISGDTGTFSLNCLPFRGNGEIDPIEFSGAFLDEQIYDAAINLVVVSQN